MMVFGDYAHYYDAFYTSKNYEQECDFLEAIFRRHSLRPVKTVLDLGCGTGSHMMALLQRGFQVSGVDASVPMLGVAKQKLLRAGFKSSLHKSSLQKFALDQKFDAVICMFSVIDYLTRDQDIKSMLARVREHLKPGGLFICDFWQASAVTGFTPLKRKVFRQADVTVERYSRTKHKKRQRLCEVHYSCLIKNKGKLIQRIKEEHCMRYFNVDEMKTFLEQAGLTVVMTSPFLKLDGRIRSNTWDVSLIARR